jgi:hypothetical protein
MNKDRRYKVTRGEKFGHARGYGEYTVTDLVTGNGVEISHPSCGWVNHGRNDNGLWYSDPYETKRDAVEAAIRALEIGG